MKECRLYSRTALTNTKNCPCLWVMFNVGGYSTNVGSNVTHKPDILAFVFFPMYACMSSGQRFNLRPNFELTYGVITPNSFRHEAQYKRPVATWSPMGVVSLFTRVCVPNYPGYLPEYYRSWLRMFSKYVVSCKRSWLHKHLSHGSCNS